MIHDAGAYSLETARAVLSEMESRGVSPTPQNFFLWSAFVTNDNPALADDIRARIESGAAFDADANRALFEKHCGHLGAGESVIDASGRIESAFGQIMASLEDHHNNTRAYGDALKGASGELNGDVDEAMLREMVQRLAVATDEMRAHSEHLESSLADTRQEVAELRTKLEKVREDALTDALTGLANRKRFDDTMRAARFAADATGEPLCLVMADIDHFKRYNDTWGHQTGDQIIRFVAGCILRSAADTHLVSRYGGEEFAVVMPNTQLETATEIAERIRTTIETKKLLRRSTSENLGNATISLGVAAHRPGEEVWELIERADKALYASKRDGRNRVTVSGSDAAKRSAA